ncbi:MAG: lysophospholipid acyltransferase family protein [Hyphomicrobium sp.]
MRVSFLRLSAGALLFLLANAMLIPAYALCLGRARAWRRHIQILWCRVVCRLAGLRIRIVGMPHTTGPTLYVSNHVSYLDIAVLSRHLEGVYVAKSEVARWPLFGTIARLTGSIFVSRRSGEARVQREKVRAHLGKGGSLLLFPEGTSTDGTGVAPFKAALFDIAGSHGSETSVQPISLAYTRAIDGTPLTGPLRDLYGWYGDMTLLPHLLRVLGLPGAEVELRYHRAVQPRQFPSRKALAQHCEEQVAAGVADAHGHVRPRLEVAAEQPGLL